MKSGLAPKRSISGHSISDIAQYRVYSVGSTFSFMAASILECRALVGCDGCMLCVVRTESFPDSFARGVFLFNVCYSSHAYDHGEGML